MLILDDIDAVRQFENLRFVIPNEFDRQMVPGIYNLVDDDEGFVNWTSHAYVINQV